MGRRGDSEVGAWRQDLFSGEGLIILKVSGHGDVLVAAYGAIETRNRKAGEQITGHQYRRRGRR